MKSDPTVIVDSREQTPWQFERLPVSVGTLDTGDYSVAGLEHLVAVERKSLADLLSCIGRERDRFKRELQRLRAYRFRMLVVEATAGDIELGDWPGQIKPAHVMGSLAAWTAQYGLPVWLAGDQGSAAAFAERYLFQAARCIAIECAAAAAFTKKHEPACIEAPSTQI